MGESKRRKKLDPNYGKVDLEKLFFNIYKREGLRFINSQNVYLFAVKTIPQDVLTAFLDFHHTHLNLPVPKDIVDNSAPDMSREYYETDWCDSTRFWLEYYELRLFRKFPNMILEEKISASIGARAALVVYLAANLMADQGNIPISEVVESNPFLMARKRSLSLHINS